MSEPRCGRQCRMFGRGLIGELHTLARRPTAIAA
jgi:hypothetical protein